MMSRGWNQFARSEVEEIDGNWNTKHTRRTKIAGTRCFVRFVIFVFKTIGFA